MQIVYIYKNLNEKKNNNEKSILRKFCMSALVWFSRQLV